MARVILLALSPSPRVVGSSSLSSSLASLCFCVKKKEMKKEIYEKECWLMMNTTVCLFSFCFSFYKFVVKQMRYLQALFIICCCSTPSSLSLTELISWYVGTEHFFSRLSSASNARHVTKCDVSISGRFFFWNSGCMPTRWRARLCSNATRFCKPAPVLPRENIHCGTWNYPNNGIFISWALLVDGCMDERLLSRRSDKRQRPTIDDHLAVRGSQAGGKQQQ